MVEEITRIIGYDRIPTTLMDQALPPQWRNWSLEGKERVRDILMGAGLQDTISYTLIGPDTNRKLLAAQGEPSYDTMPSTLERRGDQASLPAILDPEVLVRLENPLAPTADRLRSTLLGNMLAGIAANTRTGGAGCAVRDRQGVLAAARRITAGRAGAHRYRPGPHQRCRRLAQPGAGTDLSTFSI